MQYCTIMNINNCWYICKDIKDKSDDVIWNHVDAEKLLMKKLIFIICWVENLSSPQSSCAVNTDFTDSFSFFPFHPYDPLLPTGFPNWIQCLHRALSTSVFFLGWILSMLFCHLGSRINSTKFLFWLVKIILILHCDIKDFMLYL